MSVSINIHPMLRTWTEEKETLEVEGKTVGECFENVFTDYPGLRLKVLDGNGNLRRHIDVFVNSVSAYPEDLDKPVSDGDEIQIIMMVVGG